MTEARKYGRRKFIGDALLVLQSVVVVSGFTGCQRKSNMNTQTIEKSIEIYFEAWNQEGIENIKATLAKCWIAGGSYTDPRYEPMKGLDKLTEILQTSQDKYPGRKIEIASKIDAHHGSGRYQWRLTLANGDRSEGLDYFEHDADNRITRVVSFFGQI